MFFYFLMMKESVIVFLKMPITSLSMTRLLVAMIMRSTISNEKDNIRRRYNTDVLDDLTIVHEYKSIPDEFTWKHGYKSKDVDNYYLGSR